MVLNFCLCWGNILTRGFVKVFLQESEVTKMDDYHEVVSMLQKIKDNQKAMCYIKGFLKMFIDRYC